MMHRTLTVDVHERVGLGAQDLVGVEGHDAAVGVGVCEVMLV